MDPWPGSSGRVLRGRGASGNAAEEQIDLEGWRDRAAKPRSGTFVEAPWVQLGPAGPRQKRCSQASKVHVGPRAGEPFIYYLTGRK